jgi:hypothetical protein
VLETIYFLVLFGAIVWLFYWSFLAERNPDKFLTAFPFAPRDADDYRKAYGDRLPF